MLIDSLKLNKLGEKYYLLSKIADKSFFTKDLKCTIVNKVTDGAKIHIVSNLDCFKIFISPDKLAARSAVEKLKSWGLRVGYIPERGDVLINKKNYVEESTLERIDTLDKITRGELDAVVLSAESALHRFPKPELIKQYSVDIKKDDFIAPLELVDKLVGCGFVREDIAVEPAEISLRGDILDIVLPSGDAYRINFFDELIESIAKLDIENMKSLGNIDSLHIPPTSDIIIQKGTLSNAIGTLRAKFSNIPNASRAMNNMHEGVNDISIQWAIPFILDDMVDIFSFASYPVVVLDEPKLIEDKIEISRKEFDNRLETFIKDEDATIDHDKAILKTTEFAAYANMYRVLAFSSLVANSKLIKPTQIITPNCKPVTKYYLDANKFRGDLDLFRDNKFKVILCCGSEEGARSMVKGLEQSEIPSMYSKDASDSFPILCCPFAISQGVIYPDLKIALIGYTECIGKKHEKRVASRKTMFTDPKPGDYVVHREHGVGICEGTTKIKTGLYDREYIVIKYKGGDTLYVATDQTDNLQKFVGEETPKLNKLGGVEFAREKERVRASVHKLAIDLLKLYAVRENTKGYTYSSDTVWQEEFEDTFEYEETQDQLKAIADIKKDMETGKLMDRVIVGDVGFGKTEVAFRAMFKTVIDGKQAVLMAPTTILARQHFENLKKRVEPFGIKVALLSRLQSTKENNDAIKGLNDGTIHMLVCTHKGLSNKITFKDLGLLVLDEEQRFGVGHKEQLKEKYPTINILTLSATPIPRTLNMALSGLRDISMLETPPLGRLPIQTYIVEYSDTIVKEAILSECARGGQTFILLNNVSQLDLFAQDLREMLGDKVTIITANGQMSAKDIEDRMNQFYDKKADVLVCTTIIENGIDVPDANTLIVLDSEKFGLSQLYQIRGRVGRRGNLAYAYLTVPSSYIMTPEAGKRLQTLMDNTEIGSGFRVAMSDLSIRGAGTLLGAEQSGHISSVGYEMYIEMLNEAIEEIKTGVVKKEVKPIEMKVDIPILIRDGYVAERDKIRIYKRIASVATIDEKEELIQDLIDNYGPVDQALRNLIDVALIKNMLEPFNVKTVVINKSGTYWTFYDASIFKNESLMKAVADNSDSVVLNTTIPPSLVFNTKGLKPSEILAKLIDFIKQARD